MFKDKALRDALGEAAYVRFESNTPGSKDGTITFYTSARGIAGALVDGQWKSASFSANADQFFSVVKAAKKLAL